jgi:hypothetical protein
MAASPSQSLSTFVIPSAERTDADPVKSSLARAASELERGDVREALRSLRRAAEEADDSGNELRSVALARVAADLATELGSSLMPPVSMLRSGVDAAVQQLLDAGRAVPVIVKRSARDEELYVVRRAAGAAPGLGGRRAVIVLLEPDDAFFGAELEPVTPAPPASVKAP